MTLDGVRIPKYWTLKEWLHDFTDGNPAGSLVPSERKLAQVFGVSRTTVRKAIQELVVEGRITRVQGTGNFVAPPKITHFLNTSRARSSAGTSFRKLTSGLVEENPTGERSGVAQYLDLPAHSPIFCVSRLQLDYLQPIAVHADFFASSWFDDEGKKFEAFDSPDDAVRDGYGYEPVVLEETIEATSAVHEEAHLLECEPGLPLLLVTRLWALPSGERFQWSRSVFRSDRNKLVSRREPGN